MEDFIFHLKKNLNNDQIILDWEQRNQQVRKSCLTFHHQLYQNNT